MRVALRILDASEKARAALESVEPTGRRGARAEEAMKVARVLWDGMKRDGGGGEAWGRAL